MSQDNFVQIVGRLARDPELRFTQGGHAVCSFGLAWSPRKKDPNTGEWSDGETTFFQCTAWRQLGEHIAASFSKGDRVIVTGSVSARQWEDKDGNKRTSVEIDVQDCGGSVKFGPAGESVERSTGGRGSAAQAPYGDEEPF